MATEIRALLDPNLYKPDGSRRVADLKGVLIDWESRDNEARLRKIKEKEKEDEQQRKEESLETQIALFEERIGRFEDQIREAKRVVNVNEIHRQELKGRRQDAWVQELKIKQAEATIQKATEEIAKVEGLVEDLRGQLDSSLRQRRSAVA